MVWLLNRLPAALLMVCVVGVQAAEVPKAMKTDHRLREVAYNADQVYKINIVLGVGTHIVLGKDERIKTSAPGFGADCNDKALDWCIISNVDANEIFVKAKSGAKEPNNLEVTTDKRVYSFDFVLSKAFKRDVDGMFRITFKYPEEEKQESAEAGKTAKVGDLLEAKNKPRNWNYSKQTVGDSDGIDPSMAYDDGRFTYIKFAGNRQMPEVFSVEPDGSEASVATHVEGEANDTLVVHRVWKRFVLRLGKQVVGIWNDAYDQTGLTAPDGVTVKGLKRVVRGQQ